MSIVIHTLHVMLAGVWLGGVIFTTASVSPGLKAIKWSEIEREKVRSGIDKQYARVGTVIYKELMGMVARAWGFLGPSLFP